MHECNKSYAYHQYRVEEMQKMNSEGNEKECSSVADTLIAKNQRDLIILRETDKTLVAMVHASLCV